MARKKRVIELLRREYPGTWRYQPQQLHAWWNDTQHWGVRAMARCEADSLGNETFAMVFYRSDTQEQLAWLNPFTLGRR